MQKVYKMEILKKLIYVKKQIPEDENARVADENPLVQLWRRIGRWFYFGGLNI